MSVSELEINLISFVKSISFQVFQPQIRTTNSNPHSLAITSATAFGTISALLEAHLELRHPLYQVHLLRNQKQELNMRIRIRGPGGVSVVTLPDGSATVGDLLREITEKTSITIFDIKYSYPPKPLPLDQSQRSQLLSDLDVKLNGEQLIISAREAPKQKG